MTEHLGQFAEHLHWSPPIRILWVGFNEFGEVRDGLVLQNVGVHQMDVDALVQGGFEHRIIRLPNHYLEVGSIQISIEESMPRVRDKHGSKVRILVRISQSGSRPSGSCLTKRFRFFTWDSLEVSSATESVFAC